MEDSITLLARSLATPARDVTFAPSTVTGSALPEPSLTGFDQPTDVGGPGLCGRRALDARGRPTSEARSIPKWRQYDLLQTDTAELSVNARSRHWHRREMFG